ncbi:T9SS type A sorting domain-containing protein [Mariniflexile ostreae]|uniref:T9SS type A sorting domain-containing protein n=1 Tax=Mariniflexile ostreae TaxID=1520892 RepID=A0ABV5FBA0_9FLAO
MKKLLFCLIFLSFFWQMSIGQIDNRSVIGLYDVSVTYNKPPYTQCDIEYGEGYIYDKLNNQIYEFESSFNGHGFEYNPSEYNNYVVYIRGVPSHYTSVKTLLQDIAYTNECKYSTSFDSNVGCEFTIDVHYRPILNILPPIDDALYDLPVDDNIILNSHQFFSRGLRLTWQFLNNGLWTNFPENKTGNKLLLNAKDLFDGTGIDSNSYHGKYISFRQVKDYNPSFNEYTPNYCGTKSNTVTYFIRRSAPHISSQPTFQLDCYDGEQSEIKIHFDRDIKPDENITYELFRVGSQTSEPIEDVILDANNDFVLTNSLSPGIYTFKVFGMAPHYQTGDAEALYTEAKTHKTTFEIKKPTPVEFEVIEENNVTCNGKNDGSITIKAWGGQLFDTYQYSLEPAGIENWKPFTNTAATSDTFVTETITALPNGSYILQVKDANDCVARVVRNPEGELVDAKEIVKTPVIITQTSALNVHIQTEAEGGTKEPSAYGLSDGFLTANISGGTTFDNPTTSTYYNFNWEYYNATTSTWQAWTDFEYYYDTGTSEWQIVLNNAKGGTYKLTVTDKNGCIETIEKILEQPEQFAASITLNQQIDCNGGAGSLIANVVGGIAPYKYAWYKVEGTLENIVSGQTNKTAVGLLAGDYIVKVTDKNGQSTAETVTSEKTTLAEPTAVTFISTSTNVICHGGSDGSITIEVSGGTGSYTYLWNDGKTSQNRTDLKVGSYALTITDEKGCTAMTSEPIIILQPDDITITTISYSNPTLADGNNGAIRISVNGGTEPYSFQWKKNGADYSIEKDIIGLTPGIYTVTVKDANSTDASMCLASKTFTITQTEPLKVTVSQQNSILCYGDKTASLRTTIEGGNPFTIGSPYTLEWFNKNDAITSIGAEELQDELAAGYYYVIVTDANNNKVISDVVQITEPIELSGVLTSTYTACGAENDWIVKAQIDGGTAPYTYSWNTGDDTVNLNNVSSGKYLLNVKDANGCQITLLHSTNTQEVLQINEIITEVNCIEACNGEINLDITGGVFPYEIEWNTGDTSQKLSDLCAGTYSVTITDKKGCRLEREFILKNPEAIVVDLGADKTLCIGQTHKLDISIKDTNATYVWESNNGFKSDKSAVVLSGTGIYTATVTASSGCVGTDVIEIFNSDNKVTSEFLMSSQAYVNQEVMLFNVSGNLNNDSEWLIPNDVIIVNKTETSITLKFTEVNTYDIGLLSIFGDCYQEYYKAIIIEESSNLPDPGDSNPPFVEMFKITPNPNTGVFEVNIVLAESSPMSLRIFNLAGKLIMKQPENERAKEYNIPFKLQVSMGIYVVVLETSEGTQIKRLVIN